MTIIQWSLLTINPYLKKIGHISPNLASKIQFRVAGTDVPFTNFMGTMKEVTNVSKWENVGLKPFWCY